MHKNFENEKDFEFAIFWIFFFVELSTDWFQTTFLKTIDDFRFGQLYHTLHDI